MLLVPVQTVAPPVTEPPTLAGSTVMVAEVELASAQLPLLTTARYCVVDVRLVAVKVVKVLTIGVQVVPSGEDSHLMMEPVWEVNVNKVLLVPVQTVAPPLTEPPTVAGDTVTVPEVELASEQLPLLTTPRYCVVDVRSVAV